MIVICEPICREFSHEKVNSGFIYAFRLAYPDEPLRFYADSSHIIAIKAILAHDEIIIENIEYVPIRFKDSSSLSGAVRYYFLLKKLFNELNNLKIDKIFFLSYSPLIIYLIKKLKLQVDYLHLKFTFVLHGDFENIATDKGEAHDPDLSIPNLNNAINSSYLEKIKKIKLADYPKKFRIGIRLINSKLNRLKINPSKWLSTKEMLLFNHSDDFKYVVLSPHIIKNAAKYIDVDKLNIHLVMFPTNFVKPTPQPKNDYVKFGIFGYGDALMLHNIGHELSKKNINKKYEIRIIGMGVANFPNITFPSQGKPLTRIDMEKYAEDIDVFLIMYSKKKYRLGCSGTIIESLSNIKPILHFDNDCINTFNTPDVPIGICCNNISEYTNKMADIIENYEEYIPDFELYRNNIMKLRDKYAIKNSSVQLRNSFTW
jgi:hypothetical protein